jgi:hypothetical protein
MLTWGIIDEMESDLERVHDTVDVGLVVYLVHREAIPVLDGAIAKRETNHSAKLCCGYGYDYFWQYYRLELTQACQGLGHTSLVTPCR